MPFVTLKTPSSALRHAAREYTAAATRSNDYADQKCKACKAVDARTTPRASHCYICTRRSSTGRRRGARARVRVPWDVTYARVWHSQAKMFFRRRGEQFGRRCCHCENGAVGHVQKSVRARLPRRCILPQLGVLENVRRGGRIGLHDRGRERFICRRTLVQLALSVQAAEVGLCCGALAHLDCSTCRATLR